ncbi:MAG: DMT family transporter [Selenomonadaceae bacterium]|nr:DMT family transporter [Selenomonadaceae bacterium]MBQ3727098.1 DMT family transporter [Selenomonadaceae bacterium]MBQ9496401.1 DMT family transporter [Selenomonadaceae bacterium]
MQIKGTLMLLGAAFFWGTTFVAQLAGMDGLGPFSYAAARYLAGTLSLVAVLIFTCKQRAVERRRKNYRRGFLIGLLIGLVLFVASSMQQIALQYSTAGKAAFITCLYIVFVPLGAKLLGKIIRRENWLGAFLAIVGLYLLAIGDGFSIQLGDAILFVSAFVWTAQILLVDRFASRVDLIELSAAQIFIVMILSFAAMFALETPSLSAMLHAWFPILYAGVMSSGVAFTLQLYGQRYAEPSTAAILMSFEAIFGALAGWLLLGEVMTAREIFGCVLMLLGMFAAQWSLIKKSL